MSTRRSAAKTPIGPVEKLATANAGKNNLLGEPLVEPESAFKSCNCASDLEFEPFYCGLLSFYDLRSALEMLKKIAKHTKTLFNDLLIANSFSRSLSRARE
jgi:hypothetical protein